jgi:hypothetical protein
LIHKTFDEMTGNGQIVTDSSVILKTGGWLEAKQEIQLSFGFVKGDDVDQAWLIVNSRLTDWAFIGSPVVLALVDGKRHSFEGFVETSDTQIVGDDVICIESFHTPVTEEFLREVAIASSVKIRLAGADFQLDPEVIKDVKLLVDAI